MRKYREAEVRGLVELELVRLASRLGIENPRALKRQELCDAVVQALGRAGMLEGVEAGEAERPTGPAKVTLDYAPHHGEFDLAGVSIAEAIEMVREPWRVDPDNLRMYVNGVEVARPSWPTTKFKGGERGELHRPSGEKGQRVAR